MNKSTYKNPPLVPDAPEPYIIIGVDMKHLFEEHYRAVYKCQSREGYVAAVKMIPADSRRVIAAIWEKLRDYCWAADGLGKDGHINWKRITVTLPCVPGEYEKMSPKDLKALIKSRRSTQMVNGMPKCEPWELGE